MRYWTLKNVQSDSQRDVKYYDGFHVAYIIFK